MFITMYNELLTCVSKITNPNLRRNLNEFSEILIVRNDDYNEKINKGSKRNDYIWRIYYDPMNGNVFDDSKDKYSNYSPELSNLVSMNHDHEIAIGGVAYISYRISTGQICSFFVKQEYQNCGIDKQILRRAIKDILENLGNKVFTITSKDDPFWSNVYNGVFQWSEHPDPSVTGSGYQCEIYWHRMRLYE